MIYLILQLTCHQELINAMIGKVNPSARTNKTGQAFAPSPELYIYFRILYKRLAAGLVVNPTK